MYILGYCIGYLIVLSIVTIYWYFLIRAAVSAGIRKAHFDEQEDQIYKLMDRCIKANLKELKKCPQLYTADFKDKQEQYNKEKKN